MFFRFMKTGTSDGDIILIASFDEIANRLLLFFFLLFLNFQQFSSLK